MMAGRVPVPKDSSQSVLAANLVITNRPIVYLGPLLGLKFSVNRHKGGLFSFYLDGVPVLSQDGKGVARLGESYQAAPGASGFFTASGPSPPRRSISGSPIKKIMN